MAQARIPSTMRYRNLPAPLEEATNHDVPNLTVTVDKLNSHPCRKCLQDGKMGEKMLLFSYDPFLAASPYRQPGPIFVHAEPECEMAHISASDAVPQQQSTRTLSIRAFDLQNMMIGADIVDGKDLITSAEDFFQQQGKEYVEYLHIHYAKHGCFAVRIDRAGTE